MRISIQRTISRLALAICFVYTGGFVAATCSADVTGSSGSGGNIPDNNLAGVMNTVTITDAEVIQGATFTVEGLSHTWIGDLIVTVSHSTSGKSATLFHRVGTTSNAGSTGDSSDVNGTYMFQNGASSIWTESASGDSAYVVTPGTYAATGLNETAIDLDSIFAGESTQGDWIFTLADADANDDGGVFAQTSVSFVSAAAVPEPGTMATIVLGTLFGGIYLRRRQKNKLAQSKPAAA